MKNQLITEISTRMERHLSKEQSKILEQTLSIVFSKVNLPVYHAASKAQISREENKKLISLFIAAKKIEGCSENTLKYYSNTLKLPTPFGVLNLEKSIL